MTLRRSDNRRLLQVSMKPEFYAIVQQHCIELDIPMALWVRSLIQRELQKLDEPSMAKVE